MIVTSNILSSRSGQKQVPVPPGPAMRYSPASGQSGPGQVTPTKHRAAKSGPPARVALAAPLDTIRGECRKPAPQKNMGVS